eukprot:TRINITY_DN25549_c0_g1_i1.p1 TRINITY_DN25549_c0_g1~~TRINITY_DN25549_c0_g1_i1.p1  ORF type:complete len:246 (-),score=45.56 TRINITY_DN25549_c0_g1_i1:249-986(-)
MGLHDMLGLSSAKPLADFDPNLEPRIAQANAFVEGQYAAMANIHKQMKSIVGDIRHDWEKGSQDLSQSCTAVRSKLLELSESSKACDEAQDKALPELFRRQAETKTKNQISGCADVRESKELKEAKCQCLGGTEGQGCTDAKVDSDHILQCNHLRQAVLPSLKLDKLFTEKGPCNISENASFNQALLRGDEPQQFRLAWEAIPIPLLGFAPDLHVAIEKGGGNVSSDAFQHRRRSNRISVGETFL